MKIKLDARTISALQLPPDRDEDFAWDTELENFGLRLRRRADGGLSRTFIVQYRADDDEVPPHPPQNHRGRRQDHAGASPRRRPQASWRGSSSGTIRKPRRRRGAAQATHTVRATVATYLDARRPELRPGIIADRQALSDRKEATSRTLHPMPLTAVTRSHVAACIRAIASQS